MLYKQRLQEAEKELTLLNQKIHESKNKRANLLSPFIQSTSFNQKKVIIA